MRTGRSSSTAKMVAMWRALADRGATTVPGFRDPISWGFLSGTWAWLYELLERIWRALDRSGRERFVDNLDGIPIRVATIDRKLLDGVRSGCRQVVILGAGLDTRFCRLPALRETALFEVDHPATQAFKAGRVKGLPEAAAIRWVPVDFRRDDLRRALSAAGHDPSVPTAWAWEGVVMYLDDAAVSATLAAVRVLSAPGSVLVLHYHEPREGGQSLGRRLLFSWLGEPQIGLRSRVDMRALVEASGLFVREDLGIAEQAELLGAKTPRSPRVWAWRILLAGT